MWKKSYVRKMKLVSIIVTASFILLIGATLSKGGIMAFNHSEYVINEETEKKLSEDKKIYTVIPGDIYDDQGNIIVGATDTIDKAACEYHKSYSHLLGNYYMGDDAFLNSNRHILLKDSIPEKKENKGYSIKLTVNDSLQRFAYSLTEGEQASIVILKRHCGDIMALTSTYSIDFDLGRKITDKETEAYNSCSEPVWTAEYLNAYPPGSCQKVFSAAVAYETGNEDHTIDDTGSLKCGEDLIYNYAGTAYGEALDLERAFTVSSNTYFASLFNTVDVGDIRRLSDGLMLNHKIETDFGTVYNTFNFGNYSSFDIGLLGIGQKSELSAVGLAMMTEGVIDNEIFLPHVTKDVCHKDENGELKIDHLNTRGSHLTRLTSEMLSEETCTRVRQLMETAAESYGLSKNVLGAKTGTAELETNGVKTGRANMVAYDEDHIVVVTRKSNNEFGISNKEIIEKLFNKLDDIG